MQILIWCTAVSSAAVLFPSGISKLTSRASSLRLRDHLGVRTTLWKAIGLAEILAAVGLILGAIGGPIGVLASFGIFALMAGALLHHAKAADSFKAMRGALLASLLAGLYLFGQVQTSVSA